MSPTCSANVRLRHKSHKPPRRPANTGTCFVTGLRNVTRIPAIMLTMRTRSLTRSDVASSSRSSKSGTGSTDDFRERRRSMSGLMSARASLSASHRPICGNRSAICAFVKASSASSVRSAYGPSFLNTRRRNGALTRAAALVTSASRVTSSRTAGMSSNTAPPKSAAPCQIRGRPLSRSLMTGSVVSTPQPPSPTIFGR